MKIFFIEHKNGLVITDFEHDYPINENFDIQKNGDYNCEHYLNKIDGNDVESLINSAADEGFRIIDDPKNRSRARYYFGRKIARLRKESGLTQSELAEKCGLKTANLISIELGRYAVTFDNLYNIAKALGKNVDII